MAAPAPTEEEFARWLQPRHALELVTKDVGAAETALSKLIYRLRAGMIRAYAGTAISRYKHEEKARTQIFCIPATWWTDAYGKSLWRSGDATFTSYDHSYPEEITYLDIRFDPEGLAPLLPKPKVASVPVPNAASNTVPTTALAAPLPPLRHAGGAPRKAFWDDLLIAMFVKIWNNELKPQTQADIERAMLDWASTNGFPLGETIVKEPAKKLFRALKE
jgi:hypothetical protein